MNITVILCTLHHSQGLAKVLSSLACSSLPAEVGWEVLVVDNNSTDQTREVVEEFCRRIPAHFRYLFEPQPGKSYALNAGIRESWGEVLAFLDDDVTVEPTWLYNLTKALDGHEWAGAGGRIVLKWPTSIPGWLSVEGPYVRHYLPGFDKGETAGELAETPYGANMAYRKKMFDKYGGFRTDLGPSPNPEIPHFFEDAEFGSRVLAAGEKLRYEPSAVIYHAIREDRIRKTYFLDRCFDWGRGKAKLSAVPRLRLLCSFAAWVVRWMMAIEPRKRFHHKLVVWEKAGSVVELYRQWRARKTRKPTMLRRKASWFGV
jgi:glycosyltransferase involved in cell wall biosynthesis